MNNAKKSITFLIIAIVLVFTGFLGSFIEKHELNYTKAVKTNTQITDKIYDNISIHIKGAVKNPGVYLLYDGDRVTDAINAAGGLTDDADSDAINLARMINDGEEIFIPVSGQDFTVTPSGKININKADERLLKTLPNISNKMSKKIIEYREKYGNFSKTSDIKKVNGIGDKTYTAIKDFITVE